MKEKMSNDEINNAKYIFDRKIKSRTDSDTIIFRVVALLILLSCLAFSFLSFARSSNVNVPLRGEKGEQGIQGIQGVAGVDGKDGLTPYIKDGEWYVGGVSTGYYCDGSIKATRVAWSQVQTNKNLDVVIEFTHENEADTIYEYFTDVEGFYVVYVSDASSYSLSTNYKYKISGTISSAIQQGTYDEQLAYDIRITPTTVSRAV